MNVSKTTPEEKKKPERKYQAGGVAGAIFARDVDRNGKTVRMHHVAFDRTFWDGAGWQRTTVMNPSDIPKLILVASKCYEYLTMKPQDGGDNQEQ